MRSRARRRPLRRVNTYGKYFGMGPQADDAISGWTFPKQLMVKQRGQLVSRDESDDSLDKPEDW
jgi:hypothetical protein